MPPHQELGTSGCTAAPASEETSAKWVTGNGKWGDEWRQGLGQTVHGQVCSGIARKKGGKRSVINTEGGTGTLKKKNPKGDS